MAYVSTSQRTEKRDIADEKAFDRAKRRNRDNTSEENLNLMRLAGKDYKVIINKAKAAEKHKCAQELRAK